MRDDKSTTHRTTSSTHRAEFIEFMCASDVLTFGDFTTKSGRATPYFINTGRYTTGAQMRTLGSAYARTIVERFGDGFDVLFGPAYKGIPLVITTAIALLEEHGIDTAYCFNRKEQKDHGEGGSLVGHVPRDGDRVLIVEDVTTAGTAIRETVPMLNGAAKIDLVGLIVSVDRMEKGPTGNTAALEQLREEFEMQTEAIVNLDDVLEHLDPAGTSPYALSSEDLGRIERYRAQYGANGQTRGSENS